LPVAGTRPFFVGSGMHIRIDSNGNPFLIQGKDEGFVDLTFRIIDLDITGPHYRFHLSASHNKQNVGMNVVMVKGIQSGLDSNMHIVKEHVYRPGVRFLRSGLESDRLVPAIAELYGLVAPRSMVAEETFTAIALHQGHIDMETQPVKLKLFGRDGEPFDQQAYNESFFNVDLTNGFVFWNEKDPGYRKPLLRALGAD